MNWLSALTAAALFAAACNLDTVLLSAGFAARGVVLRRGYGLVIAALTTLITWLSLALGAGAAALLGGGFFLPWASLRWENLSAILGQEVQKGGSI